MACYRLKWIMPMQRKVKDKAPRVHEEIQERITKGLVIVNTGNGKGKTTAAFGMIYRSLGRGYKVAIVQFMKGKWITGEVVALKRFGDLVEHYAMGDGFTWETQNLEQDKATAQKAWAKCLELIRAKKHRLLFFDELNYVLKYEFLSVSEVLQGLKEKDPQTHIIITGRDASPELIEMADLVTEMKAIKHPYDTQRIKAQPGIDY
jgi:cob(I)alamin adenosyltransferase